MNIEEAREMLERVLFSPNDDEAYQYIWNFINEVELLLKNNSIKQTPALFKPFDKGG